MQQAYYNLALDSNLENRALSVACLFIDAMEILFILTRKRIGLSSTVTRVISDNSSVGERVEQLESLRHR